MLQRDQRVLGGQRCAPGIFQLDQAGQASAPARLGRVERCAVALGGSARAGAALGRAFDEAETLLLSRFGAVTLAQLSADFHHRLARRKRPYDLEAVHGA